MLASIFNSPGAIKVLLWYTDPTLTCNKGFTALIYACINKSFDAIDILLKCTDINHACNNARTALMYAVDGEDIEVIRVLLHFQNGKSASATDKKGKTVLIIASENDSPKVVEELLVYSNINHRCSETERPR